MASPSRPVEEERKGPPDDISGAAFSPGAQESLFWAAAAADRRKSALSAHHIFMGVLLRAGARRVQDSGQVVWAELEQQLRERGMRLSPLDWFEQVNGHAPDTRPRQPAPGLYWEAFDDTGRTLIQRALRGANVTGGSNQVHLRHLIASAFTLGFEVGLIGEKGLDFYALMDAVWRAVIDPYPEEAARWETWVGRPRRNVPKAANPDDPPQPGARRSFRHLMEPHAFRAIETASFFSRNAPVGGVHVFRAIAAVKNAKVKSAAFDRLHSLVSLPTEDIGRIAVIDAIVLDARLEPQIDFALRTFHEASSRRVLWGRELIAAVLLAGGDDLDAYLKPCGSSLTQLRDAWYQYVTSDGRGLKRDQWLAWWNFAGVPTPGQTIAATPATSDAKSAPPPAVDRAGAFDGASTTWDRPPFDSDRVAGEIPPDQDLLDASLPARRFAKLLAARNVGTPIALGLFGNWGAGKTFFMGLMRDHVRALSETKADAYVRRVVQIEFNAWHYHDTNLWASLALRIFDGLARELGGKEETAVEARRRQIQQRIQSSETRRVDAEHRRDGALERRSEAMKTLEDKRIQQEKLRRDSVGLRLRAAWAAARQLPNFQKLQAAARTLAAQFGLPEAMAAAGDVEKLKSDISATTNRGFGLFAALGHRFRGVRPGVATTIALLVIALLVLAGGWGLEHLAKVVQLPALSTPILQIAALVSAAAAWCGRRVRDLQSALDIATKVEADLAAEEQKLLATPNLDKLTNEIAALDKEIHQASEQVTAAEREIAEATAEIDHINNGGLVYDFLQGRQASTSYLSQLGLISTIREDFHKLRDLLADFVDEGANPIERVVLYIDDLDRCHPDKVVEVLQAVHLLLAFDLFNVVVGVDARWLERSLRRKYVVGARNGPDGHDFSPQDYLEKIFQIPYTLAPLSEGEYKDLIAGLVETRSDWQTKEKERREREQRSREKQQREQAEKAARSEPNTPPPLLPDTGGKAAKPPVHDLADSPTPPPEPVIDGDAKTADADAERALVFEDVEESFMQELHEFVDRPRLAKRLVNIYRLLRVRAADEGAAEQFISTAQYRVVLTLLSINVGHPKIAPKLFRAVESADPRQPFIRLLIEQSDDTKGYTALLPWSEPERAELRRIIAKLNRIKDGAPGDIPHYKTWAPRVARFSFDWYRDDAPVAT